MGSTAGLNKELLKNSEKFEKKFQETDNTMHLVIVVLVIMVAGMLITNILWVTSAFISNNKPQVMYNYTVENDPIKESAKDIEIEKLQKELDIQRQHKVPPLPQQHKIKLEL